MDKIADLNALTLEELCALRIHVESLIQYRLNTRPMLFASACKLCEDTGRIGSGFCMCDTGKALRAKARGRETNVSDLPLFSQG